jgi:hypothetical protein
MKNNTIRDLRKIVETLAPRFSKAEVGFSGWEVYAWSGEDWAILPPEVIKYQPKN